MAKNTHYRNITIKVSEDLYQRLDKTFEWGERTRVITNILEWVCDKVEIHGKDALVVLLRERDFNELVRMRKE